MNKKGMTLVEVVVAISLISVVMIFLFQVLITVVNGNKRNNTKSKTIISKTLITKAVEHDLDAFGLNNLSDSVINCSNNIDQSTINQILPATVEKEDEYYCIKLIYNENNIKNNEGYILFYKNNNKGFLAYKRGKKSDTGFILETQVVRELDAYPKTDNSSDLIRIAEESDLYSLRINIPIIATDGNNYDLALNYIDGGTLNNLLPDSNPVNFATDPWATIAAYVKANKASTASVYAVGSEKKVTIDGTDYKVRIANNSNYDCTLDSKTACGFVVEFVDIVETRAMKDSATNKGGWPATTMQTYLNGEFLNKLESIIGDNIIIKTTVISGHGSSDSNLSRGDGNWESMDKIYLLSNGEIFSNCTQSNCYDTASYPFNGKGAITTRQLDYYYSKGTNNNSTSGAIKKYNGTNTRWWLRSSNSNVNNFFRTVAENGNHTNGKSAETNWGVSPAFRIA